MACCENDGCWQRTGTHCWFLWCCICSIVGISLPRVSCIPDPIITIFLWAVVGNNEEWNSQQLNGGFGDTGIDIVVLSLVRAIVQYSMFGYNRSKTYMSLYVSLSMFTVSTVYLLIKLLYSVATGKSTTVSYVVWGLVIGAVEITLYLTFRRKRIRARNSCLKAEMLPKPHLISDHSDGEHGDIGLWAKTDEELGDVQGESKSTQPDHLAYVETASSLKSGTTGIPPETLKDVDSLFKTFLGVRVHFKHWRTDDFKGKDATVLLHGFGGSVFDWREIWVPLRSTTKCLVALDLPGSGLTSRPLAKINTENPYSQNYACKLVMALIDKLGIETFKVVGHGMGATLAVYLALEHPKRVVSVTMISPVLFMDPFPKFIRDLFRTSIGKELVIALVRSQIGELVLRKAWYDKKKIPKVALRRYEALVKVRNWHVGLVELSRAESVKIKPKHIALLSCPVRIIHGVKDKIVPVSNSIRVQNEVAALPNNPRGEGGGGEGAGAGARGRLIEIHKLEAVGHVPHEETPEAFMKAYTDTTSVSLRKISGENSQDMKSAI